MSPFPYEEFDLSDVRTYPLASRNSKAHAATISMLKMPSFFAMLVLLIFDIKVG